MLPILLVLATSFVLSRRAEARPTLGAGQLRVTGTVQHAQSRWVDDRIITESTIKTANGETVTVSQLGGHVDGLSMRTIPGAAPLVVGQLVDLGVTPTASASSYLLATVLNEDDHQFVRTGPTKGGKQLYWESGCAKLSIDAAGTSGIAGSKEFDIIAQVIQHWNTSIASCSYMDIDVATARSNIEVNGKDYVSVLKFRDDTWCRPASGSDAARCHPDTAAGITTVVYVDQVDSPRDGAIVDADIELNNVTFAVSADGVATRQNTCLADLANTLTHELGHYLGLEHTCLAPADPARRDGNNNIVPLCSSVGAQSSAAIKDATMYNFQECGETKKSSLTTDDINGVCAAYPLAKDPNECRAVGEVDAQGCCDSRTSNGPWPYAFIGVLMAGWFTRRRTRGERASAN